MLFEPAVAMGPDDVVVIQDEDILSELEDDEEEAPSSLDHEALHDDAC